MKNKYRTKFLQNTCPSLIALVCVQVGSERLHIGYISQLHAPVAVYLCLDALVPEFMTCEVRDECLDQSGDQASRSRSRTRTHTL